MQERKSQRYEGFHYGAGYSYFVTICVKTGRDRAVKRVFPFGSISEGKMELSDAGKVIQKQWNWISERFPYADAGPFVVMPDHFHGILTIHDNRNEINSGGTMNQEKIKPLSELIGAFKTTTSKMIHEMGETSFKWQRSYYDRTIRNQAEYLRIETYINDNPIRYMP
jgi:putative transposase